jgi:hypothetical protein
VLREAVLEELQRRTKFKDVILRALGLQECSVDREGDCPLWIVSLEKELQHPWHEALLTSGGDCPIGVVVNTYDHGQVVLVHEVFHSLTEERQSLIRRYAALTIRGRNHDGILRLLNQGIDQNGHTLDVLRDAPAHTDHDHRYSGDGGRKWWNGKLSQTTKICCVKGSLASICLSCRNISLKQDN